MLIRDARPDEMAEVGEIRVAAYQAGGFMSADSGYAPTLRGLGADGEGHVLVAVVPSGDAGAAGGRDQGATGSGGAGVAGGGTQAIAGTIMLQLWPNAGHVVTGPTEAEIRALAVRPLVQGRGIGAELLRRIIDRAAGEGVHHLVLCTEPEMRTARRLYERAGFTRLPERDWSPEPDTTLIVYGMRLDVIQPDGS